MAAGHSDIEQGSSHGPLYVQTGGGGGGGGVAKEKKKKKKNGVSISVFSFFFHPPLPPRPLHTRAHVRECAGSERPESTKGNPLCIPPQIS